MAGGHDMKPHEGRPVTSHFCSWADQLSLSDIPEDVKTRAKYLILDGFGCALVGAHLPWTEKAAKAIFEMEPPGQCLIWGYDKKVGPLPAALLNSTEIQSFELDDWHSLAPIHSNSVLLPALLAVADQQNSIGASPISGASLLLAIIVGYETGPRVGLCLHGSHMLTRGWHSGVVFGHAASAAAVSKLLQLSTSATEDAIGIACTQACGLMSAQFSSDVKRMQHGFAARNGLFAALMAKGGYAGIERVFEEPYCGFLSVFGQGSGKEPTYLPEELIKELGETWQLNAIRVKPHAAMAGTHCTIDAISALQKEFPEKLSNLAGIATVTVEMSEAAYEHGGWVPKRPLTTTGAQMSCAYAAAAQLIDGQVSAQQFRHELLDRDSLWELIQKIHCVHEPALGGKYEQRVTIRFDDGSEISKMLDAPKGVDPPLSNEEILDKFRMLTKRLVDDGRREMIEKLVLGLDEVDNICVLDELLAETTLNPIA